MKGEKIASTFQHFSSPGSDLSLDDDVVDDDDEDDENRHFPINIQSHIPKTPTDTRYS